MFSFANKLILVNVMTMRSFAKRDFGQGCIIVIISIAEAAAAAAAAAVVVVVVEWIIMIVQ